jgi:hypothetical protein
MTDLQYDDHQFAKRPRAVSIESGITFADYDKFHIERRCQRKVHRLPTPEWANNDAAMRNVILTFLERRYFFNAPGGATDAERIAAINKHVEFYAAHRQRVLDDQMETHKREMEAGASPKRIREIEIEVQNADSRAMFDRRPVELLLSVVYLSYRLNYDSTTVAEQLGMRPPAVRILLWRLRNLAGLIKEGQPYKRQKSGRSERKPWSKQELVRLWYLRHSGHSWAECARTLGRGGYHGSGFHLAAVYQRYFDNPYFARQTTWHRSRLQGLWVLRAVGKKWSEIGTVFGVTAAGARAVYMYHFNGKRTT